LDMSGVETLEQIVSFDYV